MLAEAGGPVTLSLIHISSPPWLDHAPRPRAGRSEYRPPNRLRRRERTARRLNPPAPRSGPAAGDTLSLIHILMNQGLSKGCSFLEDYTLNFDGANSAILQSHMLEVCPLIAASKPRLEVHFLGIGIRKSQTARLVFTSKVGSGCTATVVDLGNRFRLIVNDVECIEPKPLPKLPVASALWIPMPNFEVGAGAWILAGGTHHSCFSYDLTAEYWEDYAEIAGIEMIRIDKDTTISNFKKELRMNEVYYMLNKALC